MKKEELTTYKILKWLIEYYYRNNQQRHIFDGTIKKDLLIGELGYTDHTTINNWLTKIRYRYFGENGNILIEKILADGNELNDKYNESIIKRNKMLKQWVNTSRSNENKANTNGNIMTISNSNKNNSLEIKVQSE